MTRWRTVAAKELRALLRTRAVKLGVGFVLLVFVFGGYIVPTTTPDPNVSAYDSFLRGILLFVVPLLGLLLGYRAVVAERAGGQLTLTLSFPHSRTDLVLGKAVGRGLLVASTISVGIVAGAALVEYPFGSVAMDTLAIYWSATALYGLAYLSIGIGLSTVTVSLRRATVLTFGVFFLSVVAWPQLDGYFLQALEFLRLADGTLPDWARFVYGAEPSLLYKRMLDTFITTNRLTSGTYLGSKGPWFLRGGAAAVVLVGWVVLPTLAGYLRFRGTDL